LLPAEVAVVPIPTKVAQVAVVLVVIDILIVMQ
jgi:hypothetical protein